MADDSEFLITFPILVAFFGGLLVIAVNISIKLRLEKKRVLGLEGVVATLLTCANLVISIKYGRPFNKGHSLEGLLFLFNGAFVKFFTFVYY
jgi:hypothetical protein